MFLFIQVIAAMLEDHDKSRFVTTDLTQLANHITENQESCNLSSENTEESTEEPPKDNLESTDEPLKDNLESTDEPLKDNLESADEPLKDNRLGDSDIPHSIDTQALARDRVQTELSADDQTVQTDTRPVFDESKMIFDPKCADCHRQFREPKPEELVIYLHALCYKVFFTV